MTITSHGVSIVLWTPDHRILVSRRASHLRTYPDCWQLPGGRVDDGEMPEVAARRELQEETGITIATPLTLERVHVYPCTDPQHVGQHYARHTFLVRWPFVDVPAQHLEPSKSTPWELRPVHEMITMPDLVFGIPQELMSCALARKTPVKNYIGLAPCASGQHVWAQYQDVLTLMRTLPRTFPHPSSAVYQTWRASIHRNVEKAAWVWQAVDVPDTAAESMGACDTGTLALSQVLQVLPGVCPPLPTDAEMLLAGHTPYAAGSPDLVVEPRL